MTEAQKKLIDSINQKYGNFTSSYSGASVFVWESSWNLEIIDGSDFYSVYRNDDSQSYYFFPQGNPESCKTFISNLLSHEKPVFKYLNSGDIEFLKTYFPEKFEFIRDMDSDEYIYSIEEHISLQGKRFANCRNKLKNFSKDHSLRIEPVTDKNLMDVQSILNEWAVSHDNLHISSYKKLISSAAYLEAKLFIIYMDNLPFSIQGGYNLGNYTFDLCLAQENKNIPGGGYAAKHLLMETIKSEYKFVNMEEDLGLEGLRIAKKQMAPFSITEKWTALLK